MPWQQATIFRGNYDNSNLVSLITLVIEKATVIKDCSGHQASHEKKHEVLGAWYREQLKLALPPLIEKWESVIGVKIGKIFVQKMKTKWGSCSPGAGNVRLNTDLAKKPLQCLEYIIAHELILLLERHHNDKFRS